MKSSFPLLAVAALALFAEALSAQAPANPNETCRGVLSGSAGGRAREWCVQRAAESRTELRKRGVATDGLSDVEAIARAEQEEEARWLAEPRGIDTATPDDKRDELEAWGVNVAGLSDAQVVDRWEREFEARLVAEKRQSRSEFEARTLRNLAQQDESDARRARGDELERQALSGQEGLRQAAQGAQAAGEAALRQIGVDPDQLLSEDEDEADEAADAFGLQLYQQMIDNGLAPQCKGKQGDALIDCVDAALGADEE